MLLLALILLIASMAIVASRYISKLERQIYQRDSLIRELSISDQLVKEYFNIEIDSTGHKVSYSLKKELKQSGSLSSLLMGRRSLLMR